jgi:hypothetical protein
MRRTLVILVALAIAVLATPGLAVSATQARGETDARGETVAHAKPTLSLPRVAGWYKNTGVYVNGYGHIINRPDDRDGYWIAAARAYFYGADQPWYLQVRYHNHSRRHISFTCRGWESPHVVKEHIYRNRGYLGAFSASSTYCSTGGHDFTLRPGQSQDTWALFHSVPYVEDYVRIEWGAYGIGNPLVSIWYSAE